MAYSDHLILADAGRRPDVWKQRHSAERPGSARAARSRTGALGGELLTTHRR